MGPQRLDRTALRDRLAPDQPAWITDELADAFEPAFLAFRRQVDEAAKKRKPKPDSKPRRGRMGRGGTPEQGDAE